MALRRLRFAFFYAPRLLPSDICRRSFDLCSLPFALCFDVPQSIISDCLPYSLLASRPPCLPASLPPCFSPSHLPIFPTSFFSHFRIPTSAFASPSHLLTFSPSFFSHFRIDSRGIVRLPAGRRRVRLPPSLQPSLSAHFLTSALNPPFQ